MNIYQLICCLVIRGSKGGFLLFQYSSGVVSQPRDLQVSQYVFAIESSSLLHFKKAKMALSRLSEFKGFIVLIVCAVEIQSESAWALTNIISGNICHAKFHPSEADGSEEEDFNIFLSISMVLFEQTRLRATRPCYIPNFRQLSLEQKIFKHTRAFR